MSVILKPAKTYDEQLMTLKKRGCSVDDDEFCRKKLSEINYYRLSAYFLPFKCDNDNYKDGTSFNRVYRIYEFDRMLRSVLFSALEEIEVYLRTKIAYYHAHHYGPSGYLSAENFAPKHNHGKFLDKLNLEIQNNQKVPFVRHHIDCYDGVFPIWVITELFTFGMLSYFYSDMKTTDKKQLSKNLYQTVPKNMASWLRCCTDIRNICAHYGRLYYRIFPAIPAGLNLDESEQRRLWGTILAIRALYPNQEKWNITVVGAIEALIEEHSEDIELEHIAFPCDWLNKLKQ